MARTRALPILAVAYTTAFASTGLQLPLTSIAMERVGFSMTSVGLMWAARSGLAILGPALWGTLADRRGDARPFAAASLFSGAVLLVEIEGAEVGCGPARYLSAEEVAAVASAFSRVPVEAFAERCAPGLRDYVALHLRNLQSYYLDAAAHGHAMISYYC